MTYTKTSYWQDTGQRKAFHVCIVYEGSALCNMTQYSCASTHEHTVLPGAQVRMQAAMRRQTHQVEFEAMPSWHASRNDMHNDGLTIKKCIAAMVHAHASCNSLWYLRQAHRRAFVTPRLYSVCTVKEVQPVLDAERGSCHGTLAVAIYVRTGRRTLHASQACCLKW